MNWFLDGLAICFLCLMGTVGFQRGLIEELGRLIGLILAVLFSTQNSVALSELIMSVVEIDQWIAVFLGFTGIFSLTLIAVRILTKFFHIALLSKANRWVNDSFGFIFGAVKGLMMVIVFVWLLALLPMEKWTDIIQRNSAIARTGNRMRVVIVEFFGWDDPVKLTCDFILHPSMNLTNNQKKYWIKKAHLHHLFEVLYLGKRTLSVFDPIA